MSNSTSVSVGFGTAGLGTSSSNIYSVTTALKSGFRNFDTAEAEHWYDQRSVATALQSFFSDLVHLDNSCSSLSQLCLKENLQISTKIPPWELTSDSNIRKRAAASREQLVGFCDYIPPDEQRQLYPLDVYYIHAPECWKGWHPRCKNASPPLPLHEAWRAMEAVVAYDNSAKRIGLSNVWPEQLLDIIHFVQHRQSHPEENDGYPPPRMPDVLQAYADPLQPATKLREICRRYDIAFVSYSTLGTQHVMRNGNKNPVLGHEVILDLSNAYERSVAEVVLSWALQRGMSVIPRSSKEHHILELANMVRYPPFLEEADLLRIDQLAIH